MAFIVKPTITETFLQRVSATPKRAAFSYRENGRWRKVSFQEFYDQCREVSLGLASLGVKPGDRVALLSSTRYEWHLLDMAILGCGAVTVPIYPSLTAEEVRYILEHSESCVAIVEDANQLRKIPTDLPSLRNSVVLEPTGAPADTLAIPALRGMGLREATRDPSRFERNLKAAKPEDLFTLCYTSGTTGVPKGVMLTHANMMSVLEDCVETLGDFVQAEGEIVLSFLPFAHILGRVESIAIHTFGWMAAYAQSMEKLQKNLEEVRPTLLFTVPRVFEKAFDQISLKIAQSNPVTQGVYRWALTAGQRHYQAIWSGKKPRPHDRAQYEIARRLIFEKVRLGFGGRLKAAISGGAPLSKAIGEFFQIAGIPILEGYGLTETCAPVTLNTPRGPRFGTVGRPLPEVGLRIAQDGEILVKSAKLFKGYYKAPEETAEVFSDGWFHTGDIGFLDESGFLHITDRKKDLIVTSSGKNIAPQKIENLATAHRLIQQFVVFGDRRNYLTALVTLQREEAIRLAAKYQILFSEYDELVKNSKMLAIVQKIVESLNHKLAKFETIKKFVILPNDFTVESGELTPSLKVRRKVIAERYQKEIDSMYAGQST